MLADEGCHVAICARDRRRLDDVADEIERRGVRSLAISADVLVSSDIGQAMKEVTSVWGGLHILINNVGGGGRWGSPVVEQTGEDVWWDVYSKNAMAAVRFTMQAIPLMKKQQWGRVVTISSVHGREGGGRPWFNMAKAAEISLMKTLAMNPDLVRCGLTFNTVAPGAIMIEGTGWAAEKTEKPEQFKMLLEQLPLGRMGTPEEVANVVVFLCSQGASLVNGACIIVDGGESKSF